MVYENLLMAIIESDKIKNIAPNKTILYLEGLAMRSAALIPIVVIAIIYINIGTISVSDMSDFISKNIP